LTRLFVVATTPSAGAYLEEGLSQYTTSAPGGLLPLHKYKNRAASSMLLLRGQDAGAHCQITTMLQLLVHVCMQKTL
jgi:hypothetical protein